MGTGNENVMGGVLSRYKLSVAGVWEGDVRKVEVMNGQRMGRGAKIKNKT